MDNYEQRYILDSVMAHMERTIRRLWIMCIVVIALFAASNLAWVLYESQFQTVTETTTQEVQQEGDSNIMVGRDYGKTNDKDNNH